MDFVPRDGVWWADMCDLEDGKIKSMPLPNSRYIYTKNSIIKNSPLPINK
jgi:hypothetical protein